MGEPPEQDGDRIMNAAQPVAARPSERQLDAVSASLRRAYSDAVAEAVPDALMDLLNKLR